jgi:hypothetical protein
MTGYKARVCKCGHHEGAHNMGRPHGSRPARAGVCLYPKCGCRAFAEDRMDEWEAEEDRFERQQARWLTPVDEDTAA